MKGVLFAIGYLWALPVTAVAFVAALVGWAKPIEVRGGCVVCLASPGGLWGRFFASSGMAGTTWGGVMFICRRTDLAIGRFVTHELRHFWQARVFGPLLPIFYGLSSAVAFANGRHPYRDNIFEVDATAAESA